VKEKAALLVGCMLFLMVFTQVVRAEDQQKITRALAGPIEVYRKTSRGYYRPAECNLVYPGGSFYLRITSVDFPVPGTKVVFDANGDGKPNDVEKDIDSDGITGPFIVNKDLRPNPPATELFVWINVGGEGQKIPDAVGSVPLGYNYIVSFVDSKDNRNTSISEGDEFWIEVSKPNGDKVKGATVGYRDLDDEDEPLTDVNVTDDGGRVGPYTFWVDKSRSYRFVAYKDNEGAGEVDLGVKNVVSPVITPEELGEAIENALPMPPKPTGNVTQDVYAWLAWWYNNYVFYGKTTKLGYGDLFAVKNWTAIVRDLPQLISKFPKYWVDPSGAVVGTR